MDRGSYGRCCGGKRGEVARLLEDRLGSLGIKEKLVEPLTERPQSSFDTGRFGYQLQPSQVCNW